MSLLIITIEFEDDEKATLAKNPVIESIQDELGELGLTEYDYYDDGDATGDYTLKYEEA